ncbi:MAG TPA: TetR/AcrR family transcriptional regulator [Anaerolineales bacterium]|nr:TetR/AcrR family transcriptional regulator [Anaerolineales bacterium]HRK88932.1 TetR/AcrR family transcriptional regulator [Anaerolineales bacterium]
MKTKKKYTNHRENQVDRILDAAEDLFIRYGIDRISMGKIADTARISRKTIYEYFANKQEVAWAIFQKFSQSAATEARHMTSSNLNGYQNIEHFLFQVGDLLETSPGHMRFIVEFNTLYAREGNATRVHQLHELQSRQIHQLILMGIKDGSLRNDLDPKLEGTAILNMLAALNSRFSLLDAQIAEEYGYPVKEIFRGICTSYLRGIKAPQSRRLRPSK